MCHCWIQNLRYLFFCETEMGYSTVFFDESDGTDPSQFGRANHHEEKLKAKGYILQEFSSFKEIEQIKEISHHMKQALLRKVNLYFPRFREGDYLIYAYKPKNKRGRR